ncbi:prolyl 3-hydroxylase 3 isoform X3 [Dermochelys coriacea]|uniref:prolyl 3-hydroxylase 3 isoform X3 n=1 Tax=Dermochelys coriacea TaxID=27794 RepID=UPI0018E8EEC6|nr:prolyl 3-hydroxylase 3 isoform X3 [Dermochelys coriacea]
MALLLLLLLLALSAPGTSLFSPGSGRLLPYDLLYADGVRAYFARDWPRAAELLQRALHSYSQLLEARRGCQGRCREESGFVGSPVAPSWETRFFDRVLQRAECLGECLGRRLGSEPSLHRASREIQEDFEQREPYNYLQVALFQLKKLDEAVSAAHTFFVANPQHLQMREDMEKYQRMAGVKPESFRDLQATPYWEAYKTGVQQYNVDEYLQAAVKLEESLEEVLLALEDCRALCEGPQEDGTEEEMQPGLYEAIAAHYIQVLKCRQHCVLEVATKPGRVSATDDFIPSHLDLLQFAYDQVGNQALAAECAASYLLFYPSDELMLEKMKRYRVELGEGASIIARENIQHYVQRSLMEKKLIYYAVEHLGGTFNDPDPWTPDELIPGSLKQKHRENQEKQRLENLDVGEQEQRGPFTFEGITVTVDSHQLNGSQRVVFDRVLTDSECKDILRLAKLAQDGTVNWRDAKLLLHASEKSRKIVESYFTPGKRLHFSFTHLVCRTAVEGDQDDRMDLSHPVHADNCLLDPEGKECWREPPAYVYRDYSGILYLNDDFHGGDLFFTELDAVTITAQVHPKCGRLVAFSSGGENPHGVWAVTRGRRCAIALWYTLSSEHAEQERMEAEDLMRQGDMEQEPSHTGVEEHMRADHSGGASPEPPMPKRRARSTSQRRTSGSESGQQPQKLRARDEF